MEKAIHDIVYTYLRQETESGNKVQVTSQNDQSKTNQKPSVDSEQEQLEQEFIRALYQCLEEKGVMKEVQTFIRQRLVSILKGAWPSLVQTKCDVGELTHATLNLIQDFLCTHKLLFTFSVFTSELVVDDQFVFRDDFGKMSAHDAEDLLCALNIAKDSVQSRNTLKCYFGNGNRSLLESIVRMSTWQQQQTTDGELTRIKYDSSSRLVNGSSLEEKFKCVDEKYAKSLIKGSNGNIYNNYASITDKRIQSMMKALEKEKEVQLEYRMEKFKEEELSKIREEIETKLKFEFLQKEKLILSNFEEKVLHIKNAFKRQKEVWFMDKLRQVQMDEMERRSELGHPGVEASMNKKLAAEAFAKSLKSGQHSALMKFEEDDADDQAHFLTSFLGNEDSLSKSEFDFPPGLKRNLQRKYLLKEAELRNTIDKLQLENQKLKVGVSKENSTSNSEPNLAYRHNETEMIRVFHPKNKDLPPTLTKHRQIPTISKASDKNTKDTVDNDTDARAFLQYTVECQAEQIEKLKQAITEIKFTNTGEYSPNPKRHNQLNSGDNNTHNSHLENLDADLESFLNASKLRCNEIERATRLVKEKMNQLHSFGNSVIPKSSSEVIRRIPRLLPEFPVLLRTPLKTTTPFQTPDPTRSLQTTHVQFSVPATFLQDSRPGKPALDHSTDSSAEIEPKCKVLRKVMRSRPDFEETVHSKQAVATKIIQTEPRTKTNQLPTTTTVVEDSAIVNDLDLKSDGDAITAGHSSQSQPANTIPQEAIQKNGPTRHDPVNAFRNGALIRDKIPSSSSDEISGASIKSGTSFKKSVKAKISQNNGVGISPAIIQSANPSQSGLVKELNTENDSKSNSSVHFQQQQQRPKSLALSLIDDMLEMETGKAGSDQDDNDFF